jgi:hypothetical protein
MWRELVESACSDCRFTTPAAESAAVEVQAALGTPAPSELQALWLEANGIQDRYGDGIWSVDRVIRDNLEFRSYPEQNDLYMTFEACFFFADAGNGDQFFFPIQADGRINRPDVFVWDHESDSREWVANRLRHFVEEWFSGRLTR